MKTDEQGGRFLSLFTAEPPADGTEALDEWAFVPVADIFLVVGEGIVGITAEGIGADAKPGHDRPGAVENRPFRELFHGFWEVFGMFWEGFRWRQGVLGAAGV